MQTRRSKQAPDIDDDAGLTRTPKAKTVPKGSRQALQRTRGRKKENDGKTSPPLAHSTRKRGQKEEDEKTSTDYLPSSRPRKRAQHWDKGEEEAHTKMRSPPPAPKLHVQETAKEEVKEDKIKINRAPVLTMWVTSVAQREGYRYEEGLSFGKVIAGLMAQSKGRRLGIYEEATEEKKEERKRKRKELDRFPIFGMSIAGKTMPDGLRLAVQSGKPISSTSVDSYLHNSFGSNYDKAKEAMADLAQSYTPKEIGKVAYSLYEKFRPTVPYGVKGWGAKGYLDVNLMRSLKGN